MKSKYPGKCNVCGQRYSVGDLITKRSDGKWGPVNCQCGNAPRHPPQRSWNDLKVEALEESELAQPYINRAYEAPVAVAERPFEASVYQAGFYDAVENETGNYVVRACPGSGKTTTIRHAVPYLPKGAKVAAVAFNKRNAVDLQRAMGSTVNASTFHSLGLKNVKKKYPDIRVETDKFWKLLDGVKARDMKLIEPLESDGGGIRKIVDLARNTMSEDLEGIAEHYGADLEFPEVSFPVAREILKLSDENTDMADFADMLYWCAKGKVGCEKFDIFMQDEAQDANQVQIEVAKLSLAEGGRFFALGDPRQALYAWSGSAIDSMDQIIEHHNAKELPLSITYRMPISHVEHVNGRFPGANIEWRPNAPDGEIGMVKEQEMVRRIEGGDLVVCRVNAPLVAPAFELIRQGRKAVILGKDIGKGLMTLLNKVQKRNRHLTSLREILTALMAYSDKEVGKLLEAKKLNQASNLQDQVETIFALSDGCDTVDGIRRKVDLVFSEENEGVVFSSIHKAKGGEAKHVYLLRPDLVPHPMAKAEWQQAGEQNCLFVALTRSKHGLYFVEPPEK